MPAKSQSTTAGIPLPQLPRRGGGCGHPRSSRVGKWRAAVLIGIHVIAAIHIAHWLQTGKTISPVEPSETMYTFTRGHVNAGVVLFSLAVLSTLVFGRYFCGWGCHIIALQDLCTWMLRKVGIRPKPFRSRLLIFVPLLAALYMFAWPIAYRCIIAPSLGAPVPPYQAHFTTEDFWETFPGFWVGLLTFLTCGFVIVYLLGNKGFCTYGCPYGGVFGALDPLAPGKIRVTDACEGCGHCTATCTSNVRVHEEVRLYGMVVDPGCMKCMDCVDVCPKEALYFGFGAPTVARGPARAQKPRREYDFTWREELMLAAFFVTTLGILRVFERQTLYDAFPLLYSLGVSAISAFLLFTLVRTFYAPNVRLHRWQLRRGGAITGAGIAFRGVLAAWLLFLAHSAVVQTLELRGTTVLDRAKTDFDHSGVLSEATRDQLESGLRWLRAAERISLVPMARLEAQIGSGLRYLGRNAEAEPHFQRAVDLVGDKGTAYRYQLAQIAALRKDVSAAIEHLRRIVRRNPEFQSAAAELTEALMYAQRPDEAEEMLRTLIARRPRNALFQVLLTSFLLERGRADEAVAAARAVLSRPLSDVGVIEQLGTMLAQSGKLDDAREFLETALRRNERSAMAAFSLGLIAAEQSRFEDAIRLLDQALMIDSGLARAHFVRFQLAMQQRDAQTAARHIESARQIEPYNAEFLTAWASLINLFGELPKAIAMNEALPLSEAAAKFSLVFLYREAGRNADADRLLVELRAAGFLPAAAP